MYIAKNIILISLLIFSFSTSPLFAANIPSAKDKCPVCGMFVSKYRDWTTVITYKDKNSYFFDGAKDMFIYFHNIKKYTPNREARDIAAITVKDYYALKQIDAKSAWFVVDSDVYGPMGRELIPFSKESDAKEFMRDHKGKKILRFKDVNQKLVNDL